MWASRGHLSCRGSRLWVFTRTWMTKLPRKIKLGTSSARACITSSTSGAISQDLLKQTATHTVSDENRRLDPGGIYYSAALAAMFHGEGDNNCTIYFLRNFPLPGKDVSGFDALWVYLISLQHSMTRDQIKSKMSWWIYLCFFCMSALSLGTV